MRLVTREHTDISCQSPGLWLCRSASGGGDRTDCSPSVYARPTVQIGAVPGNNVALMGALPLLPTNETPKGSALAGAIQYAASWKTSHPDHVVVVLLPTDDHVEECAQTVQDVAKIAADGFNGAPSIPTYVIGLGFNINNMHVIAQAGGTKQAFVVDPASGAALATAMNQIRGAALPCDYALPTGASGDRTKVNIEFTPQGGTPKTIFHVGEAAGCDPTKGGWYYDKPSAPTRALVCPQTCAAFKTGGSGQVDVVLGCDTVVR